jgi:hypothetical protein
LATTTSSLRLQEEVGAWYAWPSTHAGYELVAAGMLIMASARMSSPVKWMLDWMRDGPEWRDDIERRACTAGWLMMA